MSFESSCFHYTSALISFVGLLLVAWQLRDGNKQQELAFLVDIDRVSTGELISLGFLIRSFSQSCGTPRTPTSFGSGAIYKCG